MINQVPTMPWSAKGVAYIGLAFELFLIEKDEEAISLLSLIPESFFVEDMQFALTHNADFLEVTLLLIDAMVKSSKVSKSSEMMKAFFKLKGSAIYGHS